MFRGYTVISVDEKGRFALPVRYRNLLKGSCDNGLVLTINPMERAIWLYPLEEWELIENKLNSLSDFDKTTRRTKQMMRGYASDCDLDKQGRVLLPQELRHYSNIEKQIACLGQGNKLELWDEARWLEQRDQWLMENQEEPSETLKKLSL